MEIWHRLDDLTRTGKHGRGNPAPTIYFRTLHFLFTINRPEMQEGNMSKTDWSETKRARVEAAQRPRRIIFNDDTHELALEDANTPEDFLAHRIAAARRNTGRHYLLVGVMRTVRCSSLR